MSRTHSRPTFHHQYGLTMTVVGGSFDALYDLGVKMRTWIVEVKSERCGFPEIWEEDGRVMREHQLNLVSLSTEGTSRP